MATWLDVVAASADGRVGPYRSDHECALGVIAGTKPAAYIDEWAVDLYRLQLETASRHVVSFRARVGGRLHPSTQYIVGISAEACSMAVAALTAKVRSDIAVGHALGYGRANIAAYLVRTHSSDDDATRQRLADEWDATTR